MDKLPLLRGTIVELFPWQDTYGRPGIQSRDCQLAVWCPFCARFHFHGWDPGDNGKVRTHRVAHCVDGQFVTTGYYVSVWRKKDPEYAAHVVRPGTTFERAKPTDANTAPATPGTTASKGEHAR